MKFKDFLKIEENEEFEVTFIDGDKAIYRIHDNILEVFHNGMWIKDVFTSVMDFLYAESIKRSWKPQEGDLVYYIDFARADGYNFDYYIDARIKSMIDTLYPLGLVFRTEDEVVAELNRRKL